MQFVVTLCIHTDKLHVHIYNYVSSSYFLNCSFDSSIKVHTKPVPSAVDGGAQIQQMISIEVFKAFFEPPLLNVKLTLVKITIIGCLAIAVHAQSWKEI